MRPSSSGSEPGLFGAVLARGGAADEVTDGAWLAALLEVETALAAAAADIGVVDRHSADAVASACADASAFDVDAIGAAAAATGTPVLPLVDAIRAGVPESARDAVHVGATSQDVLDTAMMLVARRATVPVLADLVGGADAAAALAGEHRATVMAGRTLGQQAVPVTFGLVCAQWMDGLDGSADRLAVVARALPLQYGGAAAKVAGDVVLLAQTEVGELSDADPTRGGSSAMAHKANPVAAVCARASARRGPGLAGTLLGAMEQEHQRAAGAWHSEWRTLTDLLVATGSAAAWLRDCLEHLVVHADRMAANLSSDLRGMGPGDAAALVDRALREHDSRARSR